MDKIALLGPEYSYSHLLGMRIFSEEELFFCLRIEDVFKAVTEHQAVKGLIPLENMLHGGVRESILALLKYKDTVKINHGYTISIHHCLAAKRNNYAKIISHPQALAQCSIFLAGKKIIESTSTAKAMEIAAHDETFAAVGSREAAEHYGLQIINERIEDNHDNVTKFLVISLQESMAQDSMAQDSIRTSLLLNPKEDRPGLLFHILAPFAAQNINLAKIESLPSGKKMGEYVFYIEIDGDVREKRVKAALDFLNHSIDIYSLGSYNVTNLGKLSAK